jgi:subtilase family serine protease
MTDKSTALASTAKVGVSIFVGRDFASRQALAVAMSDPTSADYHHFLTVGQAQQRFGATAAQQQAVAAWLSSSGLAVTHEDAYVVTGTGTAAQAEDALQAPLVQTGSGDQTRVAASQDVSVPSSLAANIETVDLRGAVAAAPLHEPLRTTHPVVPGSPQSQAITEQCSDYYGQKKATGTPPAYGSVRTWAVCGYLPSQIRDAYGVTAAGYTGAGETVAILSGDNDSTGEADADRWAVNRGEPPFAKGQYTAIIATGTKNGVGDGESALDIEAVHGMAPAANVVYSAGSGSVTGDYLLDGYAQIVNTPGVAVVTSSWYDGYMPSIPPSLITAWEGYLATGATEGQTVDFATGDYSDTTPLQYPGSDPMITCVGGTSLAVGKANTRLWEAPWATDETGLNASRTAWAQTLPGSYAEGGTGGISTYFKEPLWQRRVVSTTVDPNGMRAVPDVSALGDWNLGYQIGYTQSRRGQYEEAVNGGTSLSSPLFTGMLADAIQAGGGTDLGFANPAFYAESTGTFHDVTQDPAGPGRTLAVVYGPAYGQAPTLSTIAQCESTRHLVCGTGYDTVTGLGSPTQKFFTAFGG